MYHLWLFWLTRAEVSTSTQTVSPTKPKITTIWFVFLFLGKICQPLFYTSNIKIKAKWSSIFKNHKKTKSEPWISFNCPVQFFKIICYNSTSWLIKFRRYLLMPLGFSGSTNGKEPTCQCRRQKRRRFDPWVRKIPWRRKRQPVPVFLPRKFPGQRGLGGYGP